MFHQYKISKFRVFMARHYCQMLHCHIRRSLRPSTLCLQPGGMAPSHHVGVLSVTLHCHCRLQQLCGLDGYLRSRAVARPFPSCLSHPLASIATMEAIGVSLALITLPGAVLQSIREIKEFLDRCRNIDEKIKDVVSKLDTLLRCACLLQDLWKDGHERPAISKEDRLLWNKTVEQLIRVIKTLEGDVHRLQSRKVRRLAHGFGLDAIKRHEEDLSSTVAAVELTIDVFNA